MSVQFPTSLTDEFQRTGGLPLPAAGSILGWGTPTSFAANSYMFGVENTGATQSFHMFQHNTDGVLRIDSNVADASDATGALVVGTTYNFAMTWSGASAANIKGYKNGVLVINQTNGAMNDIARIFLSAQQQENVMLYNVELSAYEIQRQMSQRYPIRWFDLLGWWQMRGNSIAESQLDSSTWANNFASVGSPTVSTVGPTIPYDLADLVSQAAPVISVVPVLPNSGIYLSDTMLKGYAPSTGFYLQAVKGSLTLPIGTQLLNTNQLQLFRIGAKQKLVWFNMDVSAGLDGGAGTLTGTLTDGTNNYLINTSNMMVNAGAAASFQTVLRSGGRFSIDRGDQTAGFLGGATDLANDSIVFINVTADSSGAIAAPATINFVAMVQRE